MDLEKDLVVSEAERGVSLRFLWVWVSECSGKGVPSGLREHFVFEHLDVCSY